MKGIVVCSYPAEKVSYLSGIGIPSNVEACWAEVVNAKPQELNFGEVVDLDIRRDGNGRVQFKNIRVLTGSEERDARKHPALNSRSDVGYSPTTKRYR